jgi:hypothetical protein
VVAALGIAIAVIRPEHEAAREAEREHHRELARGEPACETA